MRQAAPWPVIHSPAYRSKRLPLAMRPALPDFAARCGARVRSLNLTHDDSRRKANCSYPLKAVTERHWPGGRSQKSPSGDTREALLPSECPTIFCNAHCRGPVVYQGRGGHGREAAQRGGKRKRELLYRSDGRGREIVAQTYPPQMKTKRGRAGVRYYNVGRCISHSRVLPGLRRMHCLAGTAPVGGYSRSRRWVLRPV